ncbi:nuclear transport factor 2 family protein [Micromonospora sp. 067-2]|uniref:nuclear transport factor 2 family protein n=1 Tax=Micromonospora sp. 067-2 TaxID=2789270 RepID=UPI00397C6193
MSDERSIEDVLARYVRATDRRDGAAQAALFTDDSTTQIYTRTGPAAWEPVGDPLLGPAAVRYAVDTFMSPHPPLGSSHHVTANHLVDTTGDTAHISAQFVVFEVRGAERPATGWPAGTLGAQGTVRPVESGYYETDLRRVDGAWKIFRHEVRMDLPMALPGA